MTLRLSPLCCPSWPLSGMQVLRAAGTQLIHYSRLARLEKPTGWLLLLWPTLWALWVATKGSPSLEVLTLFISGVIAARSFGCCVNDMADRKLDAKVARTRTRPLAAGLISVNEALCVAAVLAAVCFGLWLQLAPAARIWAVAALAVAAIYPFTKRVMPSPQMFLGIAFSMGIPVAFAHVTGTVPASAALLAVANFCWVIAYDTIYALVDIEDDRAAGNNSTALWLGERVTLALALCYFLAIALLMVYGFLIDVHATYYLIVGSAFILARGFVKQAASRAPEPCFRCFQLNHWFGAVVLGGFVAGV